VRLGDEQECLNQAMPPAWVLIGRTVRPLGITSVALL